jgi:transcription elongation factor GreA
MAGEPVPLTPQGLARLTAELEYLRTVKRPEIAERIHDAWENDAARDNVPSYDYAKNDQAMVEGRILELEHLIRNAQIIESVHQTDRAQLGSTVALESADGSRRTFTIVGSAEAKPAAGRISNESPVGRALIGKHVGDSVEVMVPSGIQRFTIASIGGSVQAPTTSE